MTVTSSNAVTLDGSIWLINLYIYLLFIDRISDCKGLIVSNVKPQDQYISFNILFSLYFYSTFWNMIVWLPTGFFSKVEYAMAHKGQNTLH